MKPENPEISTESSGGFYGKNWAHLGISMFIHGDLIKFLFNGLNLEVHVHPFFIHFHPFSSHPFFHPCSSIFHPFSHSRGFLSHGGTIMHHPFLGVSINQPALGVAPLSDKHPVPQLHSLQIELSADDLRPLMIAGRCTYLDPRPVLMFD